MGSGKAKTSALVQKVQSIPNLTVVIKWDGSIVSVAGGGGGSGTRTEGEFSFQDSYLDTLDYEDGQLTKIIDMHAYTLVTVELTEKGGGKKYENYLWASDRVWW